MVWWTSLFACHVPVVPESAELPPPPIPAPPPAPPEPPPVVELGRASVLAVGDTMMHGMVQRSARDANDATETTPSTNHGGFDALFAGVQPLVAAADLAFTNLETPISPSGIKNQREMVFDAPNVLLESLLATGFDVVSTANNHAYDQGRKGLAETLASLDAAGLPQVGAGHTCAEARAARIFERNGVKIALIGSCTLYNEDLNTKADQDCVYTLDEPGVLDEAKAARAAGADLVMLSVHWGVEYAPQPLPEHVELAHRLVEGGIDVILGHHPHVPEPLELVDTADGRRALIVYSMGNFVSNQSYWYRPGLQSVASGNPRDGLMVRFQVVKESFRSPSGGPDTVRTETIRTTLADVEVVPLWTVNNIASRRGSEPALIRVVPTNDRIAALEAELAAHPEGDALVRATRELEEMRRRIVNVASIVGPGWVRGAPPPDEG